MNLPDCELLAANNDCIGIDVVCEGIVGIGGSCSADVSPR